MDTQFSDRTLLCADCNAHFIFTAGEQLFFSEKQFQNDPKRCKPCKSRRSGLAAVAKGASPTAAVGLSRTETRTECSDCGVETTVPFKPTQGRPVLCRACFQIKSRTVQLPLAAPPLTQPAFPEAALTEAQTISALTEVSLNTNGPTLSPDAALLAAASMSAAHPHSSVATAADLASISGLTNQDTDPAGPSFVPAELLINATVPLPSLATLELLAVEAPEA